MKVVNLYEEMKVVTYFEIEIIVPAFVNYIAADENGELWGYNRKPMWDSLCNRGWWGFDDDEEEEGVYCLEIGKVEFEGECWKDSLEYVGEASTTVFCAKGE
ncbi:hypothetical protein [Photorhabdus sp. RM323S]|uniref:hypothetical protein n=1 Tax=Photorhabdus sp. RM323S TaxID=3342828 RepID=UPI0036DF5C15